MGKRTLILLTGMPGSGKEEFVNICIDKGLRIIRMGDFVRAEAREKGLELKDEMVGAHAQQMREKYGFDYWAKKTVDALDARPTLIDGVRGRAEINYFRRMIKSSIVMVAIHTSPTTRYERLVARNRSDAPRSRDEFEQRDMRELRWGLGDVIARSDYVIVNDSDLEVLRKRSEEVIAKILESKE